MKKITKVLATLMMLMMLIIPMASAISINDFTDFPHDSWSTEALTAAVDNDLLIGNGNGLIAPDRDLTRAELSAIVTRAFGATITADISHFDDVKPGDWYYNAVSEAVQMGAMNGTSSKTFHPEKSITREEVFTVLARVLCIEGTNTATLDKFSDSSDISDWALKSIIGLVENGYIDGYPNGTLVPKGNMTRAELAQMFHNLFKTYIDASGYHTYVNDNGSVIVRVPGAHLENVTINGDLIIADGVGAGDFDANTVTVNGRILARGGEGTVTFKKVTATENVVIFDRNGTVNFNNYRTDVPFKDNLVEHTPATFLTKTPAAPSSGPVGGGTTRYNVYFYNGDDIFDTVSVKSGNRVAKPINDPEREGYTFVYWSENKDDDGTGEGFNFTKLIKKTTKLYAIFVEEEVTYDITFDLGNGSTKVVTIGEGEKVAEADVPSLPDTETQYFRGWTTPGGTNIPQDAVKDYEFTEDTLLTPWFVDKDKKIVTFYNGTQPFETQEIPEGGNAAAPATEPAKEGAEFKHWGTSEDAETAFDFSTAIDTDTKIYAVYEYTVSFEADGFAAQKILHGKTATNPGEASETGKTFKYWSLTEDGEAYDFATPVTESITLYPVYETNKYEISFEGETPFEVEHGDTIPAENIPEKEDTATQYFKGWTATYEDGSAPENILSEDMDEYTVTKDVTFTPWYVDKDKKVVTFYNGTATFETQEIPEGGNAAAPATEPTKEGAEFKHWGTSEDAETAFDFSTAINTDTELYAVYEYTVSFEADGFAAQKVLHGKTATNPGEASETGKTFKHWSLTEDGEAYDFGTKVTDSITLYPVFDINVYEVEFIVDGSPVDTKNVEHGDTVDEPADPTAPAGMKFSHWAITPDGAEYDFATPVTESFSLYAVFVPVTTEMFDVIFKVDGSEYHSEEVNDGGYAAGPATNPEDKEESYFAGWIVEGDTTETVVDITTYAITEDTTFVALYKDKLVVTFYDLSLDDDPLHTAYVMPGETLADNQYPHHEDNYGEGVLDYGAPGYKKNDSIHSVYSGVDFVHNVPMSYWYLVNDTDTEWTAFDSTVVINEDTDVHINIKQFNAMLDVPQLSEDFSLVLWANYDENTRVIDTIKDMLFINENTITTAYETAEDKVLEKAIDKGILDEDKNILNINKRISLVQVLGKERIEDYIWEFVGDSIDTTEVAEWIKNNYLDKYATLAPEKKNELIDTFITLFDTIITDQRITELEKEKVSEIVHDFFMTMSESDIDDLINHYLCNRIKEGDTEHVKELIVSMLKAFKNSDENGLKNVVADFIVSLLGENNEITELVTNYIKDEVKNGNYGDTLVDYIEDMVDDSNANAASNKATITSIVKDVAGTNFEIVEDAISDKLDADDSFAKTVVNSAIDAENAAFRAAINEAIIDATGAPAGVVEAMTTTEIKTAFNDAAEAGDLDGSMDDIVAAALTLMKTNAAVRNSAIDAYIESVGVAALAESLVDTLQNNKSLFDDEDVAKVLDNAVKAQLELLDEDSQMITGYVDSLVTNNKFDVFADAFVKITDEPTRHDIVNSIIHEILLSTSAKEALRTVIDELVDEMFEMGHIDREFIEYFLSHMGDEANAEAFNDFMDLIEEIIHDGEQLNNIAAILGHESSSKQTAYVNQLIDELCAGELNNITVTEDRIFMFEPILEKLEQFDYEFVESKVPDKLKQVLPMEHIEELFTRFYDDAKYGYVASMRKAIADVTGDPDKTVYIDSGVTIMLNPVSDLFTPALEHAVEMKALAEGKLSDKFPTYFEYYKENPYAAALEDYLTTDTWFDGSDAGFEGTYSGYSLKEIDEYYDLVKAITVLTDDAILYYYNEVPVSDRDEVLDVALTKLLDLANIANGLVVDYATNGIPASLEDFIKSIENDPELVEYLEKFGVGAYLDKISGNANADKVYDTAFDKMMDKAGTRLEALLNKYAESKLNREYDDAEHQKALDVLKGMFTTAEGEEVYTIDTIFDDYLGGADYKKISKKNITAEVERSFITDVEDAK